MWMQDITVLTIFSALSSKAARLLARILLQIRKRSCCRHSVSRTPQDLCRQGIVRTEPGQALHRSSLCVDASVARKAMRYFLPAPGVSKCSQPKLTGQGNLMEGPFRRR